jgi:hypothetical protein
MVETAPGRFALRISRRLAALPALALGTVCAGATALLGLACGGTTGQEGLALGDTATVVAAVDASADATVSTAMSAQDSGAFDVAIQYADQDLPDISVQMTSAAEGGYPWPNCPPFIPVNGGGKEISATLIADGLLPADEVPADFSDASDSGEVFAADGSACAKYGWLGSPAIDDCVATATQGATQGSSYVAEFPPCNWCADAGPVAAGSVVGAQRYGVCLALYECIMKSGCGFTNVSTCLCGSESPAVCKNDPNPQGPCAAEEMAALEEPTGSTLQALEGYYQPSNVMTMSGADFTGSCAGILNGIFSSGAACFPTLDAGGGDD